VNKSKEALIEFLKAWIEEIQNNPKEQPELHPLLRRAAIRAQRIIRNKP